MACPEADVRTPDVEAVVLAAGLSSRFGAFKLAQPLGDRSVIEQALAGMGAHVHRAIVVVGHRDEVVRSLLSHVEWACCVANPDYRSGMFSSVRAGLAHTRAERVFLLPGDIPLVGAAVYGALLTCDAAVAIPTFNGRKGHPVLLRRDVVLDALRAPADATLRDVIGTWGFAAVPVEDEGILWDVDVPADYQRIVERLSARQR